MPSPYLSAGQYAKNNSLQRKHSNAVLNFCQSAFFSEPKETMQFLDVGCGTGDFTRDSLLPRCSPCRRIVAVDVSSEMIQFAKRHSAHEKLEYHVLDIGGDANNFRNQFGQFHRIYSFYCLQWVQDQVTAFRNIASLLTVGGQCLLVFPATQQPATIWNLLASMDRWAKYSETLLAFISKTHYMTEKEEQIRYTSSLLREAGLTPTIFAFTRLAAFDHLTEEEIIAAHMSLLPIIQLVSDNERAQLLDDVTTLVRRIHGPETDPSTFGIFIIMATKHKD